MSKFKLFDPERAARSAAYWRPVIEGRVPDPILCGLGLAAVVALLGLVGTLANAFGVVKVSDGAMMGAAAAVVFIAIGVAAVCGTFKVKAEEEKKKE